MSAKERILICDLDQTVAQVLSWENWPHWSSGQIRDAGVLEPAATLVDAWLGQQNLLRSVFCHKAGHLWFLTARPEWMRTDTMWWIEKKLLPYTNPDTLWDNATLDMPSAEFFERYDAPQYRHKRVRAEKLVAEKEVIGAIEDDEYACEIYRSYGIPVLRAFV